MKTRETPRGTIRPVGAFPSVAGLIVLAVGVLVLAGWMFDLVALRSVVPGLVIMKANTALCFALSGAALWLLRAKGASPQINGIASICAGVVVLIALLSLGEFLAGSGFGIDELLFKEPHSLHARFPGRMAPATALDFVLLGAALLLLDRGRPQLVHALGLVAGLTSFLALTGYLYATESFNGFGRTMEMALHTALMFLLLSSGVLAARIDAGLMALIGGKSAARVLVRRLLPAALVVLVVLGSLRVLGQQRGLYATEFGIAVMAVINAFIFVVLIWWGARTVFRLATGREQTEAVLRESEKKYRLLFETLQEGIWAIDQAAHTTLVNPRMAHMLGYSIAEMQGRHLFSFMDEHGVEIAKRNLERRHQGIAEQHDFELRHKDGQRVWVTMETSPLTDRDGKYIGALAGVMDITARKEAEAALRENEALLNAADSRLAEILHGMTEACYALDVEGRFTFVNDRLETLVQRPREELIGQLIFEVFPQLIGTPMEVDYRRAMKERIPLFWEILSPVVHRWLEIRVFPSGTGLAFFLHDIHERKLAEEALRASEERLRLITDLVPTGIFAKDATGRFIFANRAVTEFCGLSSAEILGKNDFDLVPDRAQAEAYRVADLAILASGIARTIASEPNTNAAGRTRFLQTTKIPFTVPETGELGVLGVWVDITAQKRAEAQILQLNGELEARVVERTADLQAAIFALEAEMLARRRLEQELLETSERERSRLGQDLHDDLGQQLAGIGVLAHLLGTQLAAETHPKAAQSAQLSVFCKNALTTARNLAKSFYPVELELHGLKIALEDLANRTTALGNLRCETRFDNGFCAEREAAIHLYRIVQESISNAIKHAQARCIVIEGSFRDGSMTLSVSDDGVGFEAPEQSRHAGMGLHIFQYRARLIGAKVEVHRISESGGCRVSCVWGRKRMGIADTALK